MWTYLGIGVVIGVLGVLGVQAMFEGLMDWWADFIGEVRAWATWILGGCGVLFIIAVFAYANGWRPS